MNIDTKKLCWSLIKADSEDEVIKILESHNLWDDPKKWRDLGDNDNNFSTAGAQQKDPIAALVEKLVNSADARLMNECYLAGIEPEADNAPLSVRHAVAQFVEKAKNPENETTGLIQNWTQTERSKNAKKITLAITGKKSEPCLTIVDLGEGQTPEKFPHTFMSLNKSNKLRTPFVQGKFNMGGTGVLRFCGTQSIQLIVTRRNPKIPLPGHPDDSSWSFTIVRRNSPTAGEKSSVYRYLAPLKQGEEKYGGVLRFEADSLDIFPEENQPYKRPAKYGSLVKLYNYQFRGKSHILMKDGLLSAIGIRLPNPALPMMFHECRGYKGDTARSFHTPFTGLVVRLDDDKSGNIEDEFPIDEPLTVDGQPFSVRIYGFKQGKADTYRNKSEGVLFVVNGQAQGTLHSRFFKRRSIKYDYIADSLLMYVDCSKIGRRAQEELFMNTRESLAESEFKIKLEKKLQKLVKDNQAIKDFNNRRRQEKIKDKIQDNKTLEDTLNNIMKKNPTLSALFLSGQRLSDAFDTKSVGTNKIFTGSNFPSFFRFKKQKDGQELVRNCEKGRTTRIQFETDVEKNYFGRPEDRGSYEIECSNLQDEAVVIQDHKMSLVNGVATLSMDLPDSIKIDEQLKLSVCVNDVSQITPFINIAKLTIIPKTEPPQTERGQRTKPPSKDKGKDRTTPSGLSLPNAILVYEKNWGEHGFDKYSAVKVKSTGADEKDEKPGGVQKAYDFFINVDNFYLLNELKRAKNNEDVIREQFKIGMILIGLALIHEADDNNESDELEKLVSKSTRSISMMLLPMIQALGNLEINDIGVDRDDP